MGKATSYNYEFDIEGQTIHPLTVGDFSRKETGEIKAVDSDEEYTISDQIKKIEAVPVSIIVHDDKKYYNIMEAWVDSEASKDIFYIGRNASGKAMITYFFEATTCHRAKHPGFDRKGKKEDTMNYILRPMRINEVK